MACAAPRGTVAGPEVILRFSLYADYNRSQATMYSAAIKRIRSQDVTSGAEHVPDTVVDYPQNFTGSNQFCDAGNADRRFPHL